MHGRDVVVTMVTGSAAQRAAIQDALDRWWGPLMQMHGPRSPREKDRDLHWRIKAKTSEELRQEFLTIYVPRIRELGLVIPDPELRFDEAAGQWRYAEPGLGRAADGRHQPRPDVAGTARVPAARPRGDALGPRGDPRRRGGRMTPIRTRPAAADAPVLEAWEVFRREKDGDPMRHGGSVMAPDAELADPLRPRAVRPAPGERPAVGRPARRHPRPRRPGPAPAAARSLVQEARRLRHARQARRRPRAVRPGQAEGAIEVSAASAAPPTTRPGRARCCSMADDEFVIGFSDSEWTGIAPLLEEDVAMSSLAQDELGHAAALYGLLGRADRHRPGRARLRPRAGRVPPLPAARPRPGRLGDDDRPTLPVRHAPTRSGSRRSPAGSWAPLAELVGKLVREERYHRMHAGRLARPAGPDRRRAARPAAGRARRAGPGRGDRLHATPRRTGTRRGRHPRRADGRARGALARVDRAGLRSVSACRCRRPPATRAAAGSTMASRSAGCGASSPRSAAPTRERPGERGRHPDRHRAAAGGRDGDRVDPATPAAAASTRPPSARALAEVMDPELPMLSVVDLGIVHRVEVGAARRRHPGRDPADLRRLPGARAHQDVDRGPARRLRPAGRGRRHVRGALDVRADQPGRTSPPCWRPASRRRAATRTGDRRPAPHRPRAARPVPALRLAPDRPRERLRADPVPDHPLLRRLPPAVRSHQAGLTVAEPRRRAGRARRRRRGRDDGRRDRPARARGRPRGPRSTTWTPAAIERGRDRIRSGLERRAARLDLDPDSADAWVDGRLARLRDGADARRPGRRRPGPRHRGRARGPRRQAGDLPRARCGDAGRRRSSPRTRARCRSTAIAARDRPAGARLGLHFFNPAPVMPLVEVVVAAVDRSGRRRPRDRG